MDRRAHMTPNSSVSDTARLVSTDFAIVAALAAKTSGTDGVGPFQIMAQIARFSA
jgi:hypothetical protein